MEQWMNILVTAESLFKVSEDIGDVTSQYSLSTIIMGVVVWAIIIGIFVHKNQKSY